MRIRFVLPVVLAFTFSTNWIAAEHLNAFWKNPRKLLETAFHQGLLADLDPSARILRATPEYWDWAKPEFLLQYSGKLTPIEGLVESLRARPITPEQKVYLVNANARGSGEGRVTLARIERVEWDPDPEKSPRIYTSSPIKVVDFTSGIANFAWIQQKELNLLSPTLWELPASRR